MHRRTLLAALAFSPFAPLHAHAHAYATPITYDPQGRPLADVRLNGQGPFPLVIDTAAAGTLLSADLIARLGLSPTGRAQVHGASGAVDSALYTLDAVEIAGLRRDRQFAVQTPESSASSSLHDGVLSARTFAGARIVFDFSGDVLRIDTLSTRAPLARPAALEFRHGVLPLTQASLAGVHATALLDTGARRTVANAALRAALGFSPSDARLRAVEPIGGATAHRTEAVAADVTPITFAGHDLGALDLVFADLPVFGSLELNAAPAVIIGVDVLRRLRTFTLDYTSRQAALEV